jgi:hypothetical protein
MTSPSPTRTSGSARRRRAAGSRPTARSRTDVELLAGDLLCEGDELGRGDVAVRVVRGPRFDDVDERVVAHLLAEGLERERASHVDGPPEQRVGTRVADRELPERIVGWDAVHGIRVPTEDLLRRSLAHVVAPQPLGVGREPLVEPDVLPAGQRDAVAVPHVGELVYDHPVVAGGMQTGSPEGSDQSTVR